jgi:type II secretion system protein L
MTHRRTTDDGPRTGALVVARARLRLIVEQFAQLGRTLDHAHAALQTAAAADDAWVLSRGPGTTAVLRSGRHAAMALDAPDTDTLIPQLEVVVAHARRAGTAPRELRVHAAASDPPTDSHAIERRLEMAVDALPAAPWWPTDGAADLLHGEFAPRRRAGGTWSRLRRPATVALAAAAVLTLATVIDVLAQRAERDAIEARMARLLTDALPGAPTVAPPAQLARALADARRRHGELAPEDALSLLATHLSAGGAPPQRIDYQGGRLALDLTQAPDATLAARLDAAGVRTSVAGTRVTLEVAR